MSMRGSPLPPQPPAGAPSQRHQVYTLKPAPYLHPDICFPCCWQDITCKPHYKSEIGQVLIRNVSSLWSHGQGTCDGDGCWEDRGQERLGGETMMTKGRRCRQDGEKSRLCGKMKQDWRSGCRRRSSAPPDSSEEGSQWDDPDMMWTTAVLLLLLPRLLHSAVRMGCCRASKLSLSWYKHQGLTKGIIFVELLHVKGRGEKKENQMFISCFRTCWCSQAALTV